MQVLEYKCSIYKDRPQECKDFPTPEINFQYHPSCTYWFDGDERRGECSRCGECCIMQKLYDGVCPYLEVI